MSKLGYIGLMLLATGAVSMAAQQAPGGAETAPQQGEVQQTPGQQTPETAHRPVGEAPMLGMNAEGRGGIELNVVVTDKSGKPVPGLGQQEFTVLDNGQARPMVGFHAYGGSAHDGQPAEAVILLDTVNMGALEAGQSRTAIEQFLRMNGGHLPVPTSVFIFDENGLQGQSEASTDGNAVADHMNKIAMRLRSMGQGGAEGALEQYQLSLKALGVISENESRLPGWKLLIWVGPGAPLGDSRTTLISQKERQGIFTVIMNISRLLRESQITVYDVSIGEPNMGNTMYKEFLKGVKTANDAIPTYLTTKVIAAQSGGLVLGPDNDMARQIAACMQDPSAYYRITFDPPAARTRDEYHEIQVQTDKPYLKARTWTGYYDEP